MFTKPPRGRTRPAYLPTAHLGGSASILAQHHEALHHHFNTLTTLGNSLALLTQVSERCPPPIGDVARRLASSWQDAQEHRVEGLICYVSFKRACRRVPSITLDEYEAILTAPYRRVWRECNAWYEGLDLRDASKDALAMHIGSFCLNLPIYDALSDISQLNQALGLVTRQTIDDRFRALEHELTSERGRQLLTDWDTQMERVWSAAKSGPDCQRQEASAVDAVFRQLVGFPSVSREKVPESISLANRWNEHLARMNLGVSCQIEMADSGYVDAASDVVIQPPAGSMTGLGRAHSIEQVAARLAADPAVCCLATFHRDTKEYSFSRKYGRKLEAGQTYVRFLFARVDLSLQTISVADDNLFAIMSPEEFKTWSAGLDHTRLVVTQSGPSVGVLTELAECSPLPPEQIWCFHWGTPARRAVEQILADAAGTEWIAAVLLPWFSAAFWLVRLGGSRMLNIYPVPWEMRVAMGPLPEELKSRGRLGIEETLAYGVLGLVCQEGF